MRHVGNLGEGCISIRTGQRGGFHNSFTDFLMKIPAIPGVSMMQQREHAPQTVRWKCYLLVLQPLLLLQRSRSDEVLWLKVMDY